MNNFLSSLIQQLGGRMVGNDKAMVKCPSHDDKNPSLSATIKNGKPLVHCFAGCSQTDVIADLKRLNLWCRP